MANRPTDIEQERDRDPMDEDAARGYEEGDALDEDDEDDDATDEIDDEE